MMGDKTTNSTSLPQKDEPTVDTPLLPSSSYRTPQKLSTSSMSKKIFSLAVPALGALLIDPLMNLTDTALVGRWYTPSGNGADALAGMGTSTSVLNFSFYIFNFFCMATTPLVGARRAAGDIQGATKVGQQAISFGFLMGGILSIFLLLCRIPLLQVMGIQASGVGAERYALDFLTVRALAAPAVLSSSAATGVLRGFLDTLTPVYILIGANIVNLGLDILLIPNYGPRGAAIATTTAEWITVLIYFGILSGKLPSADGKLGSNMTENSSDGDTDRVVAVSITPTIAIPPWKEIKPLIVASSSLLFRSFFLQLTLSFAVAMATRAGAPAVAAHQIAIQLWMLCCQMADSLEAAAQALVSDAIGRKDENGARFVSQLIFCYAAALGFMMGGILEIGRETLFFIHFFTNDPSTQEELSRILIIVVLVQPMNSLVFAADGVLQGANEFVFQAKAMALSATLAFVFYVIVGANLSGSGSFSLVHIWESLVVLQVARGLTSLYKLQFLFKRKSDQNISP